MSERGVRGNQFLPPVSPDMRNQTITAYSQYPKE